MSGEFKNLWIEIFQNDSALVGDKTFFDVRAKRSVNEGPDMPIVFLREESVTKCVPRKKISSWGFLGFVLAVVNAVINIININNNNNNNNNNDNNNNVNDFNFIVANSKNTQKSEQMTKSGRKHRIRKSREFDSVREIDKVFMVAGLHLELWARMQLSNPDHHFNQIQSINDKALQLGGCPLWFMSNALGARSMKMSGHIPPEEYIHVKDLAGCL